MSDGGVTKGSCRCETVKFEAEGQPTRMYLCHCINCKHGSASAFAAQAWWPTDKFKITAGHDKMVYYTGEEGKVSSPEEAPSCKYFCGTCYCWIYVRIKFMPDTLIVGMGGFEDSSWFKPQREYFVKRRCGWLDEVDGAEQFQELRA